MYLVSVGRHKFYFAAAVWARTLFFFVPRAKPELKGKKRWRSKQNFSQYNKNQSTAFSPKKKLRGREKKEENWSGVTLVIAVIIKTSALFLRIHVELCEFYVQKDIFWIYIFGKFPSFGQWWKHTVGVKISIIFFNGIASKYGLLWEYHFDELAE